jgi:hypothetical protein
MTHSRKTRPRREPELAAEPEHSETKSWWDKLSDGEKLLAVLAFLTMLAAALVVPEVRTALGLGPEKTETPSAGATGSPGSTGSSGSSDSPTQPKEKTSQPDKPIKPQFIPSAPEPEKENPVLHAQKDTHPGQLAGASDGADEKPGTEGGTPGHPIDSPQVIWSKATTGLPKDFRIPDDAVRPEVSKKLLISHVDPTYPAMSSTPGASAKVALVIEIDSTGRVKKVDETWGPAEFVDAAKDAVMKWRYKPYSVDGQVVPLWKTVVILNIAPMKYANEPRPTTAPS